MEIQDLTKMPMVIREGRGLTASAQATADDFDLPRRRVPAQMSGLSGTSEFWNCVKNTPLAEANKCIQHLLSADGKEIEVDLFGKHKIPVKFELKPDWLWFAAGFLTAWILKR